MLHDEKGKCLFASQEYVNRLKPRANPYWYVLEYCRHIGLRVTGKGGVWFARIRTRDGHYHQCRLGHASIRESDGHPFAWAQAQAEEWFRSATIQTLSSPSFAKGSREGLTFCPWGPVFTVAHALEDYIAWKKLAAKPSAFANMVSNINYNIVPRLGDIALEEFNAGHVRQFAVDVLETLPKFGNQPHQGRTSLAHLTEEELRRRKAVYNCQVSILRGAFELAWENGKIDNERAWRCLRRLPVAERPRITFLSRQECRRLLECCEPALRQLVQAGLYTGCRAGELTSLRVMDVGRNGYGIHITPSKSGKSRFVFLPDEGMAFFLKHGEGKLPRDHVFTAPRGRPWTGQHKEPFKKAVRQAGLPENVVFHGLRHTYASQLIQAGVSLAIVARQLGHADTQTVAQTYGHLASWHEENEIRERFAPLDAEAQEEASARHQQLTDLRMQLQGDDYAWKDPLPRSNRVRSDGALLELLERPRVLR